MTKADVTLVPARTIYSFADDVLLDDIGLELLDENSGALIATTISGAQVSARRTAVLGSIGAGVVEIPLLTQAGNTLLQENGEALIIDRIPGPGVSTPQTPVVAGGGRRTAVVVPR